MCLLAIVLFALFPNIFLYYSACPICKAGHNQRLFDLFEHRIFRPALWVIGCRQKGVSTVALSAYRWRVQDYSRLNRIVVKNIASLDGYRCRLSDIASFSKDLVSTELSLVVVSYLVVGIVEFLMLFAGCR
jgi:hypothetical protein